MPGGSGFGKGRCARSARRTASAFSFSAALSVKDWDLENPYLSVFVIDPPIGPDPRGTGEPPRHVYRYGHPPAFPQLCIHDPVEDAWRPDEYIVDRIIPWTIKWLFFHEEWVASGEWKGRRPPPGAS